MRNVVEEFDENGQLTIYCLTNGSRISFSNFIQEVRVTRDATAHYETNIGK